MRTDFRVPSPGMRRRASQCSSSSGEMVRSGSTVGLTSCGGLEGARISGCVEPCYLALWALSVEGRSAATLRRSGTGRFAIDAYVLIPGSVSQVRFPDICGVQPPPRVLHGGYYVLLDGQQRPTAVAGTVVPTDTGGRENPPPPICGLNIDNTPLGRGEVMALQLGGPDVAENVVPAVATDGRVISTRFRVWLLASGTNPGANIAATAGCSPVFAEFTVTAMPQEHRQFWMQNQVARAVDNKGRREAAAGGLNMAGCRMN